MIPKYLKLPQKYIENLKYVDCRNELDKINEQKINITRIISKCSSYKYDEKYSKIFSKT